MENILHTAPSYGQPFDTIGHILDHYENIVKKWEPGTGPVLRII